MLSDQGLDYVCKTRQQHVETRGIGALFANQCAKEDDLSRHKQRRLQLLSRNGQVELKTSAPWRIQDGGWEVKY